MKTTIPILIWAMFTGCGCSTLHQVDLDQPDQWLATAQNDLLNNEATVVTRDGTAQTGTIIKMNSDSLWLQQEGNSITAKRLDRVVSVRQSPRVFPAIGGLLGGAVVGALIGGSLGTASEPPRAEALGFNTIASGLDGMVIGSLIGGAAGGVGVAVATKTDSYQFLSTGNRRAVPGPDVTTPDSLRTKK